MQRGPATRRVALLVAAVLVVSAVVGVGGVAAQSGTETVTDAPTADGANETETSGDGPPNGTAAARLMGTVGVTEAEVEGEVERRAFGIAVSRAASNDSKVGVVASQFNRTRERLRELRERRAELNASYENGSMSESAYQARVATLAAQVNETETMINETHEESAGLPEERLEAKGINATAIQRLRTNASNLTGPEVSRIARSIAGPPEGVERGPSEDRGPDRDEADENETETDDRRGPPEDVEQGPDRDEADENETETDDRRDPPEDIAGGDGSDADDGNETETDDRRGPPEDRDDADDDETETETDDADDDETETETDDSNGSNDSTDDSSRGGPRSGGR
ncbi:MAG: hypothetical protein V5A31_09360 [Haloferacaceae archaeon]